MMLQAYGPRALRVWAAAMTLGLGVACSTARAPTEPEAQVATITPSAGAPSVAGSTIRQPGSRWVPATWSDLPGFNDDRVSQAVPALRRNCNAPAPAKPMPDSWAAVCQDLRTLPVLNVTQGDAPPDDAAVRAWLQRRFDPYRVESLDGKSEGLSTGYFEPAFEASRVPTPAMKHALHRVPADLATRRPWYTREQSETLPAARAALKGREIAYVADPLDVLMVQIQGSGRLRIAEPDGRVSTVRIAFAGHNDQPYQSVGRWLIQQGELKPDDAAWLGIRAWVRRNPARVQELLWANPRLVFFREEALPDPNVGPRGAQGVPLTPERSVAIDPRSVPYGTPLWVDTTEPLGATPLRRLMVAQDTGSAIVGAVRIDYFWGPGDRAEQQASRMKHKLRVWALVPRRS